MIKIKLPVLKQGSFLDTFIDVWQNRKNLGDKNRSRDELAFLPAALEIQESPPHPLAKWLGRSLMALFAIAVLWASFGHVNIVATAEGKIIPSSRLKQIQPLEKGVVKIIHVKEGDHVTEGEALVELDATITEADLQRLINEFNKAKGDLERLQQFQEMLVKNDPLVAGATAPLNMTPPSLRDTSPTSQGRTVPSYEIGGVPTNVGGGVKDIQSQLLQQQWQQYLAQRSSTEQELAQRRAEQQSSAEIIKKLQGTLPLITKRVNAIKGLMEKKMATETEYLQIEEQRITQQQDLAAQKAKHQQLNAAITQAEQQLKALEAQVQSDTLSKISETQRQVNSLQEEFNKATDVNARQILYAPVSGQVQGLAINTVGGVVTEAQQLMMIVPEGEHLEVEVFLQNKDIGFVHEGDEAEIKVHTFPFTKYGIIPAMVTRISDDAFAMNNGNNGADRSKPADENNGLVYTMGLQMARNTIRVNEQDVPLLPGMAVTAEVKTGERRIIEFFLAPLMKARQESIRER